MFALVAAVILFLHGLGVVDNTENVNWLIVGLALWALHFAFAWVIPVRGPWNRP